MIEGISTQIANKLIQASSEFGSWKNHSNADFVRHMSDIASSVSELSFPGGLLPIIRDSQIEYYALAGSTQQWRELAIRIRAFAGPTLTNFEPRQSDLQNSDSFESVLIDSGITHVSKFGSQGDRLRGKLTAERLRDLVDLIKNQPSVERALPRPTSRVLWEFDSALLLMDKSTASACIAYLEDNLRLDAENLAFMRVRLHSKFEEWDAIRRKDVFDSLIEVRRPPEITNLLFEAIYHRELAPHFGSSTPAQISEIFLDVIGRSSGTLFDRVPPQYSTASITCFALWFQLTGLGTDSELDSLREQAKNSPNAALIEQLLASTQQSELSPNSTTDQLKQILSDTPSKSGLRILATELKNYPNELLKLDIADYILGIEGFDLESAISDDEYTESSDLLEIDKRPGNWVDLFDISLQVSATQIRDLAKHGVDNWPISDDLDRPDSGQSISGRLIELAARDHEKALTLTPFIFEVLDSSDSPDLGNIYSDVFDTLMLIDIKSDIVLRTISTALEGCLLNGVSTDKYSEIVHTLGGFAEQLTSPSTLSWVTDVLELLVTYPCPVRSELENTWAIFAGEFQRLSARMDADTVEVLKELEELFGFQDVPLGLISQSLESDDPAIINSWINFPSNIVLYSLASSAAERAARILRAKLPSTQIVTMDAKVNSTRLESSVKSADAVCIAWLKATHSATDAIRDVAGKDCEIIYAKGGGSSSMIRAVNDYVDGMN